MWTRIAVIAVCLALYRVDAAEYERGPVPSGGELFHASFDKGSTADLGMGWGLWAKQADYEPAKSCTAQQCPSQSFGICACPSGPTRSHGHSPPRSSSIFCYLGPS